MKKESELSPNLLTYEISTSPSPLLVSERGTVTIVIKSNKGVYLDEIYLYIPAGSSSTTNEIFLTEDSLTDKLSPDTNWQLNAQSVVTPSYQAYSITSNDQSTQITNDLSVTIVGTVNAKAGVPQPQIKIGEHSASGAKGTKAYREGYYPVSKSAQDPFYLQNFLSFSTTDPDIPKTTFSSTEAIYLSWQSLKGSTYTLYPADLFPAGNSPTEPYITIEAGMVSQNQTIALKATKGSESLIKSLAIQISDPILTPKTSDVYLGMTVSGEEAPVTPTNTFTAGGAVAIEGTMTVNGAVTVNNSTNSNESPDHEVGDDNPGEKEGWPTYTSLVTINKDLYCKGPTQVEDLTIQRYLTAHEDLNVTGHTTIKNLTVPSITTTINQPRTHLMGPLAFFSNYQTLYSEVLSDSKGYSGFSGYIIADSFIIVQLIPSDTGYSSASVYVQIAHLPQYHISFNTSQNSTNFYALPVPLPGTASTNQANFSVLPYFIGGADITLNVYAVAHGTQAGTPIEPPRK